MKLKVRGIESIVITDPNRVCGTRKRLDQSLLQDIRGQAFTAAELKQMFGYAPNTALADTQLAHYIRPVKKMEWEPPNFDTSRVNERATRWRVK